MNCQFCNADNPEHAGFCLQCGKEISTPELAQTDQVHSDEAQGGGGAGVPPPKKKKHRILKLIIELAIVSLIGFIIGKVWFYPSHMPKKIWNEGLRYDVKAQIENELSGMGDFTVPVTGDLDSQNISSHNQVDLSEIPLLSAVDFEGSSKAQAYSIQTTWPVYDAADQTQAAGYVTADTLLFAKELSFTEFQYYHITDLTLDANLLAAQQQIDQQSLQDRVQLHDYYLSTDYKGDPVIGVVYTWTNTNSEATSAMLDISISTYQNGVELSTHYDIESSSLVQKKVQPGMSIELYEEFELDDLNAPVEIVVGEWITWDEDAPAISVVVDITQ